MTLLNLLNAGVIAVCVAGAIGCGKAGEASNVSVPNGSETPVVATPGVVDPNEPTVSTVNPAAPEVTSTPDPNTVYITYYSISQTATDTAGGSPKKWTATGSCATYLSKDYCWDDGLKTVTWTSLSTTHSYWGIGEVEGGSVGAGSNEFTTDVMTTPTVINTFLAQKIDGIQGVSNQAGMSNISAVLTYGTVTEVECTMDPSTEIVDCGTFSIDPNQVPLN